MPDEIRANDFVGLSVVASGAAKQALSNTFVRTGRVGTEWRAVIPNPRGNRLHPAYRYRTQTHSDTPAPGRTCTDYPSDYAELRRHGSSETGFRQNRARPYFPACPSTATRGRTNKDQRRAA